MRISKKSGFVLILLMISVVFTGVYAADALYRFMHNDHDALVIGEIISADENAIKVRVEKSIVSSKDLNVSAVKKQLKLDEAKIIAPYGSSIINPSVGDYVLLSLIKHGDGFKIAWGAYKVDSLDYKDLSVVLPEAKDVWSQMDAAAVKAFVNSDGKITEFSFDGNTKTVRAGEEQTVIFDGDDEETINIAEDINKDEIDPSVGIIGGADGPTSIYISGNLRRVWIIPAVMFTIGAVLAYFIKAKRRRRYK